jgi:hypothetical protein
MKLMPEVCDNCDRLFDTENPYCEMAQKYLEYDREQEIERPRWCPKMEDAE